MSAHSVSPPSSVTISAESSDAFVLAQGLDVVNADIQSMDQLRENVVAAVESPRFFA
ncbi:MAG: hypothetical protein QNK03_04600 [Myxococcota bacterium]|nr:hypothetical protein [Myxococcota bacterium]